MSLAYPAIVGVSLTLRAPQHDEIKHVHVGNQVTALLWAPMTIIDICEIDTLHTAVPCKFSIQCMYTMFTCSHHCSLIYIFLDLNDVHNCARCCVCTS
jgi:hypothetical protein